jgi:hypothetical protein
MIFMSKQSPLDANTLAQFTGSQHFYRHSLVREVLYTEGAQYVADTAGAHWLLDEIALAQLVTRDSMIGTGLAAAS